MFISQNAQAELTSINHFKYPIAFLAFLFSPPTHIFDSQCWEMLHTERCARRDYEQSRCGLPADTQLIP